MKPIIVGTRGSALALVQAEMTEAELSEKLPDRPFVRNVITTTGDRRTDVPLSEVAKVEGVLDKGVFTKELEVALAAGTVDMAVHSMKDVPTVLDDAFVIAGVLERAPICDVLISKHLGGLDGLPKGATVATSSVRRQRQLLWLRPDLKLVDIRGNVPTRIEKLEANDSINAIMLAEAGLVRLGYLGGPIAKKINQNLHLHILPADEFLPAAGQGIVGFEIRKDDDDIRRCVEAITHAPSMIQSRAEREFLRLLDAGCHTPVGVRSWIENDILNMSARVFDENTSCDVPPVEASVHGDVQSPEKVANDLFRSVTSQ